jgi:hypothetical protein
MKCYDAADGGPLFPNDEERTADAPAATAVQRQDRHVRATHVTEGHGLTARPASRPT